MSQSVETLPMPDGAILVTNNNMAPNISHGCVAFLEEKGFRGESVYSFPYNGLHPGDLRKVMGCGWLRNKKFAREKLLYMLCLRV
jgi:hypothetical protein